MPEPTAAVPRPLRPQPLALMMLLPRQALLAGILMVSSSVTEVVGLLLLVPLLQVAGLEVGEGGVARLAEGTATVFAALGIPPTLLAVLGVYIGVITLRAALQRTTSIVSFAYEQEGVATLRERLFRAVADSDWLFFQGSRGSSFTQLLTYEIERVGNAVSLWLSLTITALSGVVYFGLALLASPFVTLVVSVCGTGLLLVQRRQTRKARAKGEGISDAYETLYATLSEAVVGMKTAKSHGVASGHVKLFMDDTRAVAAAHLEVVRNSANTRFWFAIGSVVILSVAVYVALEVQQLPTATLLLLLYLFSRLMPILGALQGTHQAFLSELPAVANLAALEARCAAAAEAPDEPVDGTFDPGQSLVFHDVSFAYDEGAPPVLSQLDLTIAAGKTTAVVGVSGVGKSTLADLAIGLLTPSEGAIFIGGQPLAKHRHAWRRHIGYVAQDTFLFHDSVRTNLLLAAPGADERELKEALEAAAAEFAYELPQGLDTVLGDRGVRLSGGQRQRLALARALLRQPALLILDEATSSLDAENERRIQRAIDGLHSRMTMLVITHRLATIRNADVIHVLDKGKVSESGTWETLFAQNGRFRALCEAQGLVGSAAV